MDEAAAGPINRKKQKRRQKQAAREAADKDQYTASIAVPALNSQPRNGHVPQGRTTFHPARAHASPAEPELHYGYSGRREQDECEPAGPDDVYYSEEDVQIQTDSYAYNPPGHYPADFSSDATRKSKNKRKNRIAHADLSYAMPPPQSATSVGLPSSAVIPPLAPISSAAVKSVRRAGAKDRIWNTSTAEERERIKEFWLSLGEEERKALVKIEKEAVLRKMKEQQKQSCSCTVCGRKRTAIEEELEVLYDAYYEELEQYANHQEGGSMLPPPKRFAQHPLASVIPPHRFPGMLNSRLPQGRVHEQIDGEEEEDEVEDDEEEYSDEDVEEESYSDADHVEPEELPRGPAADFFQFGNSLTVKGGILTVADDLLKNDGKKFIEMMEQLAERRMQREEEAQYAASALQHPSMAMPPHPPPGHPQDPLPDEDEYDEEDEEYDSQDYDEEDEDEVDTMTEEQRMEEGRRMFQIFAARMFEQRVLTAYREKVARERQQKLLEELEDESRLDAQREAKKARDAQKKKDKKQMQKQKQAEEKAKREAEKAAEDTAAKEAEAKKQEEQRRKAEEKRKKKEAERKAQEEEKARKEAEKNRRLQEEKERQQEAERKVREQKAAEKRTREEAKRREREEREAREREVREKKAAEEKERQEREAHAKAQREAQEKTKREEQAAAQQPQILSSKRPSLPAVVALPPTIQQKAQQASRSPHLQVATPNLPKAPTLSRPRQASQQDSHSPSPAAAQIPSKPSGPTSPGSSATSQPSRPSSKAIPAPSKPTTNQSSIPQHPQPPSPNVPSGPRPGMPIPPAAGHTIPHVSMNGFPNAQNHVMHAMAQRGPYGHTVPMFPPGGPHGAQYRSLGPHSGMPGPPPGMVGMPHLSGFTSATGPVFQPSTPAATPFHAPRASIPSHTRNQSASIEKSKFDGPSPSQGSHLQHQPQPQPIGRPAPIGRPSSVKPIEGHFAGKIAASEVDELANHLGSSALLGDDTDDAMPPSSVDRGVAHGNSGSTRPIGFSTSAQAFSSHSPHQALGVAPASSSWGAPGLPFQPHGSGSGSGPGWGATAGGLSSWSNPKMPGAFGSSGRPSSVPRAILVRHLLCRACQSAGPGSFHPLESIHRQVEALRPSKEEPIPVAELLDICETEGDANNGGGQFVLKPEGQGRMAVKWQSDAQQHPGRGSVGLGEIGSPVPSSSVPTRGFQKINGIF